MATNLPPGALKTTDDHEVGPVARDGLEVYNQRQAARSEASPRGAALTSTSSSPASLPWSTFLQRHPDYDAQLWAECRALYAGGPKLLRDKELMTRIFPSHRGEDRAVYEERVKRAHYFPYAGSIIDHLVAGLAADPVSVQPSIEDEGDAAAQMPGWWTEFIEDVSPEGGRRQSCQQLLIDQIREALIVRCSWTLIDLPQTPEEYVEDAPKSLLEQERRGLLDPYAIAIPAEFVIDWQDDQNGELEWALVCDTEQRRAFLTEARRNVTKTFTYYSRTGWARYQITYDPAKPPEKDDPVPFLDEGFHPFTKVPLVRSKLPEGLWAMGKLESLAREHLNKRCAQGWAEYKALFKILYEFMAPEDGTSMNPVSEAQEDPERAISQVRGQGYTQIRGHQDRAEYIGPDTASFAEARASCDQIMREMHRVMYSMALSVDMGAAAIRRSGDSKAQDKGHTSIILKALGKYIRDSMRDIVELVSKVKDVVPTRVTGAEKFDAMDVGAAVKEAVEMMNGVPIKSPTFKKAYLMQTYTTVMPELTEEEQGEIRRELDEAISVESMMMEDAIPLMGARDEEEDEDEDEEAEDEREVARSAALGTTPVPRRASAGRRQVFDSQA